MRALEGAAQIPSGDYLAAPRMGSSPIEGAASMTSHPYSKDYQVVGVDVSSHEDVVMTIRALSEANARAKAELRGVIVTNVTPLAPVQEHLATTSDALEIALAEEIESVLAEEIQSVAKAQQPRARLEQD